MCTLPKNLLSSKQLLQKYMGEYRDLSTDCSIRSESHQNPSREGVVENEGGRARFNWQDRKRFDLKGRPSACGNCQVSSICEGIGRDIWIFGMIVSLSLYLIYHSDVWILYAPISRRNVFGEIL